MMETVSRTYKGVKRNTLLLVSLFVAQLAIYINASAVLENFPRDTAWLYMCIPLFLMVYSQRAEEEVKTVSLWTSLKHALAGFWLTYAAAALVFIVLLEAELGTTPRANMMSMIVLTILFVAPSEELMFRAMLPKYLEGVFVGMPWVAWLLSQATFAGFHFAAYGGSVPSMVIAFIVGMVWLAAYKWTPRLGWLKSKERLGLGFTIGSHAAYNLVVSGILVGNVTMICGGL
jgi:membrane protease YdiL (CAAX protease family)